MGKLSRYGSIDRSNPEAAARCDRGGEIRKRHELKPEMIWAGARQVWNGFLCCDAHRDRANPQDRLLILKPDPVPVANPRPDIASTPLPYFVSDGIPGAGTTTTEGYVTDQFNRPLFSEPLDPNKIFDNAGTPQQDMWGQDLLVAPEGWQPATKFPFA